MTVGGATFSTIDEGLITTESVTRDPRALLRALGIIHIGHDA